MSRSVKGLYRLSVDRIASVTSFRLAGTLPMTGHVDWPKYMTYCKVILTTLLQSNKIVQQVDNPRLWYMVIYYHVISLVGKTLKQISVLVSLLRISCWQLVTNLFQQQLEQAVCTHFVNSKCEQTCYNMSPSLT